MLLASSRRGKPFAAAQLTPLGASAFGARRPGLLISSDLAWRSSGLCVTTIKVYDTP